MNTLRQKQTGLRAGYTLIELLIVVAIIGIMLSLSIVVMFGITDQASEEATVTTIQKVNRLLELRVDSFNRAFPGVKHNWSEEFTSYVASEVATREGIPEDRVKLILGELTGDSPVWEILGKKAAYRFEFPQRLADILFHNDANNNGIPDNLELKLMRPIAEQQVRNGYDGTPPNSAPSAAEINTRMSALWARHTAIPVADRHTESSELLYFCLFYSGNFGSAEVARDEFTEKEIADTDGDGLPEFVDAWGQPLRFYRWPTRLIDPSLPIGPFAPVFSDPNESTDLKTVLAVDRVVTTVGVREVDIFERSVADLLMKGLPRKLQFTDAYLAAVANNKVDRPGISDVEIIIPPDALLRDPDDPAGLLYSLLETGLPAGNFVVDLSWEFNEQKYHTPDTFHAPLIVSAGPDAELGLYEPTDTARLGNLARYNEDPDGDGKPFHQHASQSARQAELNQIIDILTDNLTNRNRRSGGRR